jgi:hypothetical protein
MSTIKEDVLKSIAELPDDTTLDDIEYNLYVRRKVEEGRAAIRRGEFITQEAAQQRMKEWEEKLSGLPQH